MPALTAAQIPDGLVYGIVPIIFSAVFAWGAWITLVSARSEGTAKANAADIEDHEQRIRELEAKR